MAWADTTRKAEGGGGGVSSVNVTLNSTIAGNFIAAGSDHWTGSVVAPTLSDNVNGSYTTSFSAIEGGEIGASLNYFANNGGGNLTITFNYTQTQDVGCYVHEFSGGATSNANSGTAATATSTANTAASTGAMTPADSGCLLIGVMGVDANGSQNQNQTGSLPGSGTTWTLSNDRTTAEPGSMVFLILPGAATTCMHVWSNPSAIWAAGVAAFKPGAAAAAAALPLLIYGDLSGIGSPGRFFKDPLQ